MGRQEKEPVQCDECKKAYCDEYHLKLHKMRVHARLKQSYACEICFKVYDTEQKVKDHAARHMATRNFICDVCNRGFKTYSILKRHKYIHSSIKPFKCDCCEAGFSRKDDMVRHQMRFHIIDEEKKFMCQHCGKKIYFKKDYERHLLTHSSVTTIKGTKRKVQKTVSNHSKERDTERECKFCKKSFEESSFQSHRCLKRKLREEFLGQHEESVIKETTDGRRKKERRGNFQCDICQKVLTRRHDLKRHLQIKHPGEKSFPCPTCKTSFLLKIDVDRHMIQMKHGPHANPASFRCSLCYHEFDRYSKLQLHACEKLDGDENLHNVEVSAHGTRDACEQIEIEKNSEEAEVEAGMEKSEREEELKDMETVADSAECDENVCDLQMEEDFVVEDDQTGENFEDSEYNVHGEEDRIFKCKICQVEFFIESEYQIHVMEHIIAGEIKNATSSDQNVLQPKTNQTNIINDGSKTETFHQENSQTPQSEDLNLSNQKKKAKSKPDTDLVLQTCQSIPGCGSREFHKILSPLKNISWKCGDCAETFTKLSDLSEHVIKTHKASKCYFCEFCRKSFDRRYDMIVHRSLHWMLRPYKCYLCEKRYVSNQHLMRHITIHRLEKFSYVPHFNMDVKQST